MFTERTTTLQSTTSTKQKTTSRIKSETDTRPNQTSALMISSTTNAGTIQTSKHPENMAMTENNLVLATGKRQKILNLFNTNVFKKLQ